MYLVFDLETETHTAHKRKASPFSEKNWVVARGWKKQDDARCSYTYHPKHDRTTYLTIPEDVTMLVGFNIKFDLLWEMAQGNPYLHAFYKRGGRVWCCQYAEYLLEAQHPDWQMAALNDVAPKYGGTKKIDEVKALWEAGVQTSDIPEDLLIDYLVGTPEEDRNGGDIRNTEIAFLGQIERALKQGQIKMIQDRMDGLLATTEMEYRGLKVDVQAAGKRLDVLNGKLAAVSAELDGYVPDDLPFEFNWGSRTHTSCLIFGGTVKYQQRSTYKDEETGELARFVAHEDHYVQADGSTSKDTPGVKYVSGKKVGTYKMKKVRVQGELKMRLTDFFYTFPGHTEPNQEWATKNEDGLGAPIFSTSGDVLIELGLRNIPFLKAMRSKQKLDKEIGTYYARFDEKKQEWTGMLTFVQPHDHIIHHSLNHTSTVTSRLSSSNPNGQNLTRPDFDTKTGEYKSEVKGMFVSRFGDDGECIEADYSQLEVVVQGVLSEDEQLCQDLRDQIDFHCKRVAAKHSIAYEVAVDWCKNGVSHAALEAAGLVGKVERTKCKIFSFQRAYGAGAPTIAEETGMSLEETKALIEAEEALYPGVVVFNAAVETACKKSAKPFQALGTDGKWRTYRRGYWQAPTGTLYTWRSYDAPEWQRKRGVTDTFMPPELKNYPVQGTGGEFVQAMCGRLWRHFVAKDFYNWQAFLVNTVHDCVWTDSHKSVRDEVARDMKRIMESIPEFYNNRHGMNITVPFPVEVEYGPNMLKLHHWKEAA